MEPRTYRWLDRLTKLLGLVLVTVGLAGVGGSLSPVWILLGLVVGVATVFVDAPD